MGIGSFVGGIVDSAGDALSGAGDAIGDAAGTVGTWTGQLGSWAGNVGSRIDPTSSRNAIGRVLGPALRPAIATSAAMLTAGTSTLVSEKTGRGTSVLGTTPTVQGFMIGAAGGGAVRAVTSGIVQRTVSEIAPVTKPAPDQPRASVDGSSAASTPAPVSGGWLDRFLAFAFPR